VANSKYRHFIFALTADRPKTSRLIAFVLGAMATFVFAPVGWSLLAPLLMIPLLYVGLTASPKDAASHYFWFGFGMFLVGTYWIYISVVVFGNAALWIALMLMVGLSLIIACLMWIAGWLTSSLCHGEPWRLYFVGPAAWVLIEWVRGWIFTGFPWLAHGYGQIDSALAGFAPVLGVYGVSLMLLFGTVAVLVALMTTGRERIIAAGLIPLPWILGGILDSVDWTEDYGKAVRTTIIQAGLSQDEKWLPQNRDTIMENYRTATLTVPDSELVIWPEVAIPARDDQVESFIRNVGRDAKRNEQTVLLGILEYSEEYGAEAKIYNSVFMLGGEELQIYRKRHLVPFGEYFPVPASVREWMRLRNLPYADLAAGDDVQPLLVAANGAKLSIAICYEDAYGSEYLYAFPGADILINVSNDAWFGDSLAPHQHLQIARMRALEFGRYAVRSTNTGISAFIGPDGELLQTSRQFETDVLTHSIRLRRGTTVYAGSGNWPVIGFCFLVIGFSWVRSRAGI
jgi:apolipoprotein N-acyltransferase